MTFTLKFAVTFAGITLFNSLIWAQSVPANGSQPQYLMAALGDSITAGAIADTSIARFNNLKQGPYTENLWTFLSSIFDAGKYVLPLQITEALETRYELSWATGTWIASNAQLLKQYYATVEPRASVTALNVAKSGGLAADVITQAQQIASEMATGNYASLKYVTLLIGNNDACHGVSDAVMSQNLIQAFSILNQINQKEPVRVLVSSLPRIPDLGQPQFMNAKTLFDMSCREMRINLVQECAALTNWSTPQQYQSLMQVIDAKNAALAQVVTQVNQTMPHIQAVFSTSVNSEALGVADLAVDCFHPNADAQLRMSAALWNDQPWFH